MFFNLEFALPERPDWQCFLDRNVGHQNLNISIYSAYNFESEKVASENKICIIASYFPRHLPTPTWRCKLYYRANPLKQNNTIDEATS